MGWLDFAAPALLGLLVYAEDPGCGRDRRRRLGLGPPPDRDLADRGNSSGAGRAARGLPQVCGRVDVAGLAQVAALDQVGRDATQPLVGHIVPGGAVEQHRMEPLTAVGRGDDRPGAVLPRRDDAVDRARVEVGPVGEDDERGLDVVAQRREPAAQRRAGAALPSGQWTVRASVSTWCAPMTTSTSSTALRADAFEHGRAGAALLRRAEASRCTGGEDDSGDSATLLTVILSDDDRLASAARAGSPSVPIWSTTSEAVRHLADDRVVRRQADVVAGDDEELAAGRAGRLGARLRHRDDAVRVLRVGGGMSTVL